ncbi:MAG: TonB-dependent receptor, partial [Bryobacteraceae bacterium]|nr:TonB-dependent receptor [Bryobacteraceae bacterium]
MAGVTVVITNVDTNSVFTTETTGEGFYAAPSLPVGNYTIIGERAGFKRAVRSGVRLQVDQRADVDLVMQVGAVAESVEVRSEAPLVDTGSATIGKVIENRRVVELPLNGRNALALTLLTPGVKSNAGSTNSGFGDRGVQLSSISINGGPNAMNGMVLDGGNNIQSYVGEVAINPGVDAVEEFKVQSGPMSAEYGFTGGGVVNVVTKSGTNRLHGTVYEFFRNDKLDARNSFAVSRPPFRYNQYGASAGGPIIKDRTFVFGNWEQFNYIRSQPFISTFPTALQRTGDFSDLRDAAGRLIPIYDPATTRANPNGTGFIRDAFADNKIPQNRLDPAAQKIQSNFYPVPNRTPSDPFTNSNNFQQLGSEKRDMNQYTLKLDHRFSDKNTWFGRYSRFQHKTDNGSNIYPNPVVSKRDDDLLTWNVLLSDTHVFTPTLLNEVRVSATRGEFPFVARSFGGDWPSQLGLPSIVPNATVPSINNGTPGFNTGTVGFRGSTNWQFLEQITKIFGGHTLKAGFDFRLLNGNNFQTTAPSGSFSFASSLTGNPLSPAGTGSAYATFLLGEVSSASVTTHVGQTQSAKNFSGYVQDDWKITRRLTLNLGLRWDLQTQPVERNNGTSNFDPSCKLPNGLTGCTVYAGVNGQPRAFRQNDYNDFAPRFGFALDVFGNSRTVLRGGYGIFYPAQFWRENYGSAAGFAQTSTAYNPSDANRAVFKLSNGFTSAPVPPQGAALGPAAFLGTNASYDEKNGQTPMSQQFSFSLQQQMPGNWLIDAGYAGNLGRNFTAGSYDLNQLDPKFLSLGLALQAQVPNAYAGMVPGSLGSATITREQSLRPFPWYGGIEVRNPRLGNFNSHLFLLSVEKRMARGFTALFSFTGGKVMSDSIQTPVNFGPIEQASVV